MIAGPEVTRVLTEFEAVRISCGPENNTHDHHDQQHILQVKFIENVKQLVSVFEELGNPFLEEGKDLIVLDTHEVVGVEVVKTVETIERLGKDQYSQFVKERLINRTTPITDPLKRAKLPLFPSKSPGRKKQKKIYPS